MDTMHWMESCVNVNNANVDTLSFEIILIFCDNPMQKMKILFDCVNLKFINFKPHGYTNFGIYLYDFVLWMCVQRIFFFQFFLFIFRYSFWKSAHHPMLCVCGVVEMNNRISMRSKAKTNTFIIGARVLLAFSAFHLNIGKFVFWCTEHLRSFYCRDKCDVAKLII